MIQKLFRYEPMTEEQILEQRRRQERAAPRIELSAPPKAEGAPGKGAATVVNRDAKVGRNDPCPCGSGKKYKKCHGAAVTVG
jgi:preprotein translocase subunit SecA